MDIQNPLVLAFLTGLLSGFLVSMPIGPINITLINEAANHGFLRAWLVGLGAVTVDLVYCSIGLTGFATLFTSKVVRAVMELVSFILVLYLGLKYFQARSVVTASRSADVIEKKLHPHTAYMTGFVRVLGNPAALLLWLTLSAMWVSHEWVEETISARLICVIGVMIGAVGWFTLISAVVSRQHRKLPSQTLLRLSHFSGLCLLLLAVIIGVRLVGLLARR